MTRLRTKLAIAYNNNAWVRLSILATVILVTQIGMLGIFRVLGLQPTVYSVVAVLVWVFGVSAFVAWLLTPPDTTY